MSAEGFWLEAQPLLLASGSAARRAMLVAAGLPVEVTGSDVDERSIDAPLEAQGAQPAEIAAALARAKALAVSARQPGRLVLGGDQIMSLSGRVLHKPASRAEAEDRLAAMAGTSHQLHSAFALARGGACIAEGVETATLHIRELGADFRKDYLDRLGDEALTTVGVYKLEAEGVHLFDRIDGSHFTVLGLPMLKLLASLRALGAVAD